MERALSISGCVVTALDGSLGERRLALMRVEEALSGKDPRNCKASLTASCTVALS